MDDDLEKLKRDYRAIAAPPYLATRIRASVGDTGSHFSHWMSAALTGTAVLALVWVLPFSTQVTTDVTAPPTKPSMSALAALKPSKPSVSSPSMTQLRSVSVPKMPAKPKPVTSSKPQTNNHFDNTVMQEKNDAYI